MSKRGPIIKSTYKRQPADEDWPEDLNDNREASESDIYVAIRNLIATYDIHGLNNANSYKTFLVKFYKSIGVEKNNRTPWYNYESVLKQDAGKFIDYLYNLEKQR